MKINLNNSERECLIDDSDVELIREYEWHLYSTKLYNKSYARATIDGKKVTMHRLLLDSPDFDIDHIDGDGLNNCRNNLRLCTNAQNQMNRKKKRNSISRYKGVYWDRINSKWIAEITYKGIKNVLGRYVSENEAGKKYNEKAKELFGDFAKENRIDDIDREYPENIEVLTKVNKSSQYKGISWDSHRKKWIAHTRIGKKRIKIGRYETEFDALTALNNYKQNIVNGGS